MAKKSGTRQQRSGGKKGDSKQILPSTEEDPGEQPEGPVGDPDPPQLGEDPNVPQPPLAKKLRTRRSGTKPKSSKPKDEVPGDPAPKNTTGGTSGDKPWYKTGVTYDTKKTRSVAVPPQGLLDVTRKRKSSCQPKPSTSEGPSTSKRKRTTPTKRLPHTQLRSTYMMGDKITPVLG